MSPSRPLLDIELRGWGRDLLEHLGHWLTAGVQEDLGARYERIGRLLCEHEARLHQCLRGLFLIREKVLEYLEDEMPASTGMEVQAEEELQRRLGRFFDLLAVHLAAGYEAALKKTAATAAH